MEDTKNKDDRTFTVEGQWADVIKIYIKLRPKNVDTQRFFLNYQHGKCTKQHIGKNEIAGFPREIADFLGLENSAKFKGHGLRGTYVTVMANSGASALDIKQAGG